MGDVHESRALIHGWLIRARAALDAARGCLTLTLTLTLIDAARGGPVNVATADPAEADALDFVDEDGDGQVTAAEVEAATTRLRVFGGPDSRRQEGEEDGDQADGDDL